MAFKKTLCSIALLSCLAAASHGCKSRANAYADTKHATNEDKVNVEFVYGQVIKKGGSIVDRQKISKCANISYLDHHANFSNATYAIKFKDDNGTIYSFGVQGEDSVLEALAISITSEQDDGHGTTIGVKTDALKNLKGKLGTVGAYDIEIAHEYAKK